MQSKGTIPRVCQRCGAAFLATVANVKRGFGLCCSRACSATHAPVPLMLGDDRQTAQIPLLARDGSVRAYTIVDAADAAWANQWRWHLGGGYAIRGVRLSKGRGARLRTIRLHRELMGLGLEDKPEVDHISRDKLDNRRSNLRVITRDEQAQNKPSKRGASSSYRGVSYRKDNGTWTAQVRVGKKLHHFGCFASEIEAAEVAHSARARLLPFAVD